MTLPASLLSVLNNIVRHPWRSSTIILTIYVILCQMFHKGPMTIGGPCGSDDTLSVRIDTFVYYDTIPITIEFTDTTPESVTPNTSTRFRPPDVDLDGDNCADSLAALLQINSVSEKIIDECDSTLREYTSVRTFSDDTVTDSGKYRITYSGLKIKGFMIDPPTLKVINLTPDTTIRETVTVREPIKRKFGIGAEIGPQFNTPQRFRAVSVNLNIGYMDRKNNFFYIGGGYNTLNQWEVKAGYNKFFDLAW